MTTTGAQHTDLRIDLANGERSVAARFLRPASARALLVLAHGAGAGMHHVFMETLAAALAGRDIATLRYQFPYMDVARGRPDRAPVLIDTVARAVATASDLAGDLPVFAGGKSMGGRMTSMASAEMRLEAVRGIAFFGFPLHPAGKPATSRGDHLASTRPPLLFLQGTRDRLAELELLTPICSALGDRATLHVVDGADHGFHVLKRSGRDDAAVMDELVERTRSWIDAISP